jgi:hypothetical protein
MGVVDSQERLVEPREKLRRAKTVGRRGWGAYLGCGVLGLSDSPQLRHLLPLRHITTAVASTAVLLNTTVHSCSSSSWIDWRLDREPRGNGALLARERAGRLILIVEREIDIQTDE